MLYIQYNKIKYGLNFYFKKKKKIILLCIGIKKILYNVKLINLFSNPIII